MCQRCCPGQCHVTYRITYPERYAIPVPQATYYPVPQGCICPPTSEATCKADTCPRRAYAQVGGTTG